MAWMADEDGENAMRLDELPDFLTIAEAAAVLRLGRSQAYEQARIYRATGGRHGLPVVEFGRALRVPKAVIIRLASGENPGLSGDAA